MDGALLVANQDVLDLVLLEELVVNIEDRAAGIAEDVLDALFLKTADGDFRTGELHDSKPFQPMKDFRSRARENRASANCGDAIVIAPVEALIG